MVSLSLNLIQFPAADQPGQGFRKKGHMLKIDMTSSLSEAQLSHNVKC